MLHGKLIKEALEEYKTEGIELKARRFDKDKIYNLLRNYKCCGYLINEFCCNGPTVCCWQEVVEEGIWSFTRESVKRYLWRTVKSNRGIFRSRKKYERFYIYENPEKTICKIFIYARDTTLEKDFHIWFSNESLTQL